jgi:hypothetical protein
VRRIGYRIRGLGSGVAVARKIWASPDIPDTFDSVEDDIGGIKWNAGDLRRSSSVRR